MLKIFAASQAATTTKSPPTDNKIKQINLNKKKEFRTLNIFVQVAQELSRFSIKSRGEPTLKMIYSTVKQTYNKADIIQ